MNEVDDQDHAISHLVIHVQYVRTNLIHTS